MIQCEVCEYWRVHTDYKGKEHFSCKKLGFRSTTKWKRGKCSSFKLEDGQEVLFADV